MKFFLKKKGKVVESEQNSSASSLESYFKTKCACLSLTTLSYMVVQFIYLTVFPFQVYSEVVFSIHTAYVCHNHSCFRTLPELNGCFCFSASRLLVFAQKSTASVPT